MTDNDFQVWMPLEPLSKGIADGHARPIQGFATTDDLDLQQEVIVQNGIDVGPLLEKGFIDWDHKGNLGPQYIIGEPVSCELRAHGKGEGWFLKGFLYENHPVADAAWAMLERSNDGKSQRQLGFSIEGHVSRRMGKFVQKAVVRHIALTHQPINTYTFAQLAKSLVEHQDEEVSCKDCRENALQHLMIHKGMGSDEALQLVYELVKKGLY